MAILNVKNFPDELYGQLKRRAEREHRSVAQEVVHLLSAAVDDAPLSILGLKGLGRELWEGVDAAEYVGKERRGWD